MIKTGICPKCNSDKVVRAEDTSWSNNGLEIVFGQSLFSTKYICCECGYLEEKFESEMDRLIIHQNYSTDKKKK